MPDNSFLGTGMKFPPQINSATGRFAVSSEAQSVKESVYLILMTQQQERLVRPDFGSTITAYTFMDVNVTTLNLMIRALKDQILSQEPRIENVDINVDSTSRPGCLIIGLDYILRGSNVRDNLVFPFYLNADVEEEEYEPEQYSTEQVEEITD